MLSYRIFGSYDCWVVNPFVRINGIYLEEIFILFIVDGNIYGFKVYIVWYPNVYISYI